MSRRQSARSAFANPVLVGAVTTLVVTVAIFLSYNANQGLPFVPTYELRIETANAARLVVGNEVREGGYRIGQITELETVELDDGRTGAQLVAQLAADVGPIPADSTITIRPRSTLGLKYVDLRRGEGRPLPSGAALTALDGDVVPPELDDLFNTFTEPVREDIRTNLETFGGGLAGRGNDINRALAAFPGFLRDLQPVMRTLADPRAQLGRFVRELQETAVAVAPVADDLAAGFTSMATTFEALSRSPEALKATISEGPATLRTGIRELPRQRPFLRALAGISDELEAASVEVRATAGPLAGALSAGTDVLPDMPPFNQALGRVLDAGGVLARGPLTNPVVNGLTATMQTLGPTLRYVGPHITVCNYWNYWWTLLSDHLSEEESTGTLQRIGVKSVPEQEDSLQAFNRPEPANGEGADPVTSGAFGDPAHLHAQPYGRAVDEQGLADCESGQRGYPERLAERMPPEYRIAIDARTPGRQGTTFTGRESVPQGQTFSAEPAGDAPPVVIP